MHRSIWSRFLRRCFSQPRQARRGAASMQRLRRAPVQLYLEKLEDRTLLSAPTLTYTVNIAGDNAGAAGTGTSTAGGGSGNLRWCVDQADAAVLRGSSYALIQFDPTVFPAIKSNTIDLSNGELAISDNVTIEGPQTQPGVFKPSSLTISGTDGKGGGSRVFDITSFAANVTITGVTIANGNANVFYTSTPGNQGGNIFNGGNLTLQDDVVTNGFSVGAIGGPPGRGGGIFNAEGTSGTTGSTLTLDNTIVEDNEAQGVTGGHGFTGYLTAGFGGRGGPGYGGGIYNDSNALLIVENGSQIVNDTALGGDGGDGGVGLNAPAPGSPGGVGGKGGNAGGAAGGGIFNAGTLELNGTGSSSIVIGDNVAQGGVGGDGGNGGNATNGPAGLKGGDGGDGGSGGIAVGGGVYNTGIFYQNSTQNVQYLGDETIGGLGGNGGAAGAASNGTKTFGTGGLGGTGGAGGAGGDAQGGALYNAVGTVTISSSQFGEDADGNPDQALGGVGGAGNTGNAGGSGGALAPGGAGGAGGAGGNGGNAFGGAAVNAGTSIAFQGVSFTSSLAKGGTGGNGSTAGNGNLGGAANTKGSAGVGGMGGAGGPGGAGGSATGGAIYNLDGTLAITSSTFTANQSIGNMGGTGGIGGVAGQGGPGTSAHTGGPGAVGGKGGAGGSGGNALGGGFYSDIGSVTVGNSSFVANASGVGNQAIAGSGNSGGNAQTGGLGGDNSKGPPGPGIGGGAGGDGGDGGLAGGGAGGTDGGSQGNQLNLNNVTITSSLVESGSGGAGANGGNGGNSGNGTGSAFGFPPGAGGDAGAGGNAGPASGGAIYAISSSLTVSGNTIGGSSVALGNQVVGGAGGAGGIGGTVGGLHHAPVAFTNFTPAGNGGQGGLGAFVSGGAIAVSSAPLSNITVLNSYLGMDINDDATKGGEFEPPDTQGAAGPNSYIETVNQTIGIFTPNNTGVINNFIALPTFFFINGKLPHLKLTFPGDIEEQSDPFVIYDSINGRFIVGDLDFEVDPFGDPVVGGANALLLAVSTSSNPQTMTKADWNFSEINTAEPGVALQDYPGNPGYNADALVVTTNSFGATGILHSQINTISMSALVNGTALATTGPSQNVFQTDFAGVSMRPTVMQDSKTGDPMWFIEETDPGVAGSPPTLNDTINVVKMSGATNILTTTPKFTTYSLPISNPYYTAAPELQPNGLPITFNTDSRFMDASMRNGEIVTAQTASDKAQDLDQVQWYEINTSGSTPTIQQQGVVAGFGGVGPKVGAYDAYPGIAINSNGAIGMSFLSSGLGPRQYMSTYITGRIPTDLAGSMETPILIQAGSANYIQFEPPLFFEGREGDMSGISVDPNGAFWIANEYASSGTLFNWGTVVARFTLSAVGPNTQAVSIANSTFTNNSIGAGDGGLGGRGGLYSTNGTSGGINGTGGDGGDAQGGALSLSALSAQDATLTDDTVTASSASAGKGGAGNINFLGGGNPFIGGWNGHGSPGGDGGSVTGVGLAALNYNLNASSTTLSDGTATAGQGGKGGGSILGEPSSWGGGAGGNGGSVQGGGIFFSNGLGSPLKFSFNGGSASNYTMTAGGGGTGGNAGASGSISVTGGAGGNGGQAQGGGLYVFATPGGTNTIALTGLSLVGDQISAGDGGLGGAGFNAKGGNGGSAQGGGLYNNSKSTSTTSSLTLADSTLAGDRAAGGAGGAAGSATTPNGGAGGAGGDAGNAQGAGLFNGTHTALMVYNSTFGGGTTSTTNTGVNYNVVVAGNGGAGGNAGTPAQSPKQPGGAGGAGGSAAGGNVYISSNTATFMDDTIVFGQATTFGVGGAGGSSAGLNTKAGPTGTPGTGTAGGYYAAKGSTNIIGNTIIGSGSDATGDPDVFGSFTSKGNNLLTSLNTTDATGFNTGSGGTDKVVTSAQLDLGPLLNNGGPTMTDAAQSGSVALEGGNATLVPSGVTTDQRGFSRFYPNSTTVDVGAIEFQVPVINSPTATPPGLQPSTIIEGSPGFTLTINGNFFMPGATVSFNGTSLTPTSETSTQLQVVVPAKLLLNPGTVQVIVFNPDGSGLTGAAHTVASAPATFTIAATPFTLNNPGDQTNDAGDTVKGLTITPAAGFQADKFSIVKGTLPTENLPPGLSINANTGVISGTIEVSATPGTYSVTVNAYETGTTTNASVTFHWIVNPPPTLANPFGNLPNQEGVNDEGDTVSVPVTTANGKVANSYSATGLPPGLSINTTTGVISGTVDPRGEGIYNVTVTPDGYSAGSVKFTWLINDSNPPTLFPPPGGVVNNKAGDKVSLQIKAEDADAGTFTATGLQPLGLSINANTGVISGTISAKAAGNYQVTVQAADGAVESAPMTFTWSITGSSLAPPAPPAPPPSPTGAPGVPPGVMGVGTNTAIVSVQNVYLGIAQVETVSVAVTTPQGYVPNEGIVAIQVNGQTVFAPVHHGMATATVISGLLDFGLLFDLFFPHSLTAGYSDSASIFAPSGTGATLTPILLDFFLFEIAQQVQDLTQFQGT